MELPRIVVDPIVARALEEDLAGGDVTTEACIDEDAVASARAVARRELVVCGGPVFAAVYAHVDPSLRVELLLADGARAATGAGLFRVSGRARAILMGERVALNFVQ